jgi:hypothetical protein
MLLFEGLRDPQGECPNSNLKWSLQSQHQLASSKTSQPVAAKSLLFRALVTRTDTNVSTDTIVQ